MLFSQEGYTVETAIDGTDALSKLTTFNPDVVFLDIMMTPMDGLAFLSVVTHNYTVKAPYYVFIMTAMSGINNELKRLQALGMIDDYAIKPIIFGAKLLADIHTIVEIRRREKPQE